jgi:hypothetical protein
MENDFKDKSILIYDIETTSLDVIDAKIKWFGAYSYFNGQYYLLPFDGNEKEIRKLIRDHKILVGFNNKDFDNEILKNNFKDDLMFEYKVLIDLLEISAPKSGKTYGKYRKNRLAQMGVKLKNFTLKNIIEVLKLDEQGTKGDIDYKIFQKDEWSIEEVVEIKKYLKQDVDLTMKLFEWYHSQFKPLMKFLPQKEQDNLLYIKSSLSALAYNIICNKAGLPVEYGEKTGRSKSYEGGHHIEAKYELVRGNIIEIDIASAYPHAIMMANLHSFAKEGDEFWDGDGFYTIEGKYNKTQRGKVELALQDIFLERIKAKKSGDKAKNMSYKIIINSHYGTTGNPTFKSIYNKSTASDCTSMVRTWLKKLAKHLTVAGFECLYGFTDSIFVLVPEPLDKEVLMFNVNEFISEAKTHVPFPMDTFKMEIEEEIRMIWFVAKNCYLWVTQPNKEGKIEIKYKSTLLNTNTPRAVMKLFESYMTPIIIEKLDIPFTKKELETQIKLILEKEPSLAAQEYKVTELKEYKVTTSIQYQIAAKYGPGRHFLLPNRKDVGVGLAKHSKKKAGLRYCTFEEFEKSGLKINDIDLTHLLSHLKPFYERNEKKDKDLSKQANLCQLW